MSNDSGNINKIAQGDLWRGQEGTLYLHKVDLEVDELTELVVGALQDVSVDLSFDIETLSDYAGAIKPLDHQVVSSEASMDATLTAWEIDALESLIGYDKAEDEWDWSPSIEDRVIFAVIKHTPADRSEDAVYMQFGFVSDDIPLSMESDGWTPLEISGVITHYHGWQLDTGDTGDAIKTPFLTEDVTKLPYWHHDSSDYTV